MAMTQSEISDRIIAKASEDSEYRSRLMADPRASIQELTGASIPDAFTVQVHEESATSFHLVLPPSSQLSEQEMSQVFGGINDWGNSDPPAETVDNVLDNN